MARPSLRSFDPDAVKRFRQRREITQQQLADQLGMRRTNYVLLESGRRTPGPGMLKKLGDALGVHPQQLTHTRRSEATLRDLREWAGLEKGEAASAVGVSVQDYTKVERALRPLTDELVETLARLYGCTPRVIRQAYRRGQLELGRELGIIKE